MVVGVTYKAHHTSKYSNLHPLSTQVTSVKDTPVVIQSLFPQMY